MIWHVLAVTRKRKKNTKRRTLVKMEKSCWSVETKFSVHGTSLGQYHLRLHLWVSNLVSWPHRHSSSSDQRSNWKVSSTCWVELLLKQQIGALLPPTGVACKCWWLRDLKKKKKRCLCPLSIEIVFEIPFFEFSVKILTLNWLLLLKFPGQIPSFCLIFLKSQIKYAPVFQNLKQLHLPVACFPIVNNVLFNPVWPNWYFSIPFMLSFFCIPFYSVMPCPPPARHCFYHCSFILFPCPC